MGDFKINKLNPFAWLGLAFYKAKENYDYWKYKQSYKTIRKYNKKIEKD